MFYFTKQEKIVILFLTGSIILGSGIQWARSSGYLTSIGSIKMERKANPVKRNAMGHPRADKTRVKININTADIDALISLPGIGRKTAAEIITYREKTGKFRRAEDLKNVRGIGEKKFDKLKDKIGIDDKTTVP